MKLFIIIYYNVSLSPEFCKVTNARDLQLLPMCSNGKAVNVNGGLMTAGILHLGLRLK